MSNGTQPDEGSGGDKSDTEESHDPDQREFRDPDQLRVRAGVRGDPGRDQHFLIDDRVLHRLPAYATSIGADTGHILEVGGGTGALTDRLLAVADRVTVIEQDTDLAGFLHEEFAAEIAADRLRVRTGNALDVALPAFTCSVSNLPYGISSEIAFRLLPEGRPMVLTFQKEFARRMAAAPGDDEYSRLSVTAGHYADVEIVEPVPPEAFEPQPAVDSAVVRTLPRDPEYEVPDESFFMEFLRAVFTQRRKTMRNAIRNTTHISGLDDAESAVGAAPEDLLNKRAGDLTPAAFARLATIAWEVGEPGQ